MTESLEILYQTLKFQSSIRQSSTFPRHQNLTKGVIMGDCNARVGKYQNMDILEENIVDPCLLRDSKDCVVTNYGRIRIHMLDCLKWYKCFSFDKCTHMFASLKWGKCSGLCIYEGM